MVDLKVVEYSILHYLLHMSLPLAGTTIDVSAEQLTQNFVI